MPGLNSISQTHLCVLFADNAAHNPLARMPVYAEIAVTETVGAPQYTKEDIQPHVERENQKRILKTLSKLLSRDSFDALDDNQKKKLTEAIETLVNELSEGADFKASSEEVKQERIDDAVARALEKVSIQVSPPELKKIIRAHPLGYIATDHVGYASFDLRNFQKSSLLTFGDVTEYEFFVYPMGKEGARLDVLAQARITKEAVFAKFEIQPPIILNDMKALNMPSMQNPSLVDWYLSPSSFAVNPAYFIGQDGCENLFPANFATQEFRFFQIVRGEILPDVTAPNPRDGSLLGPIMPIMEGPKIRVGWSLEYKSTWQPLGHTLGSIVYSLPLAPGEIVKIAILDWQRKSKDGRDEDLTIKEQLAHNTRRDRTVSETVEAALHEWQRGGNIMGGNSGGAGIAGMYSGIGFSAGNAHSFGGGYSTSSGDRNITASTVQQATDAFSQHSAAQRELRSTIVVQSDQSEFARGETRVIANHNHSHALTMLYYEVLRHYKVSTEFMRTRASLLVDYSSEIVDFKSDDNLLLYRLVLEQTLLDPRLKDSFSSIDKLLDAKSQFKRAKEDWENQKDRIQKSPKPGEAIITRYEITILTGNNGTDGDPYADLFTINKEVIHLEQTSPEPEKDDRTILGTNNTDDFEENEKNIFLCNGSMQSSWKNLERLRLGLKDGSAVGEKKWNVKKLTLKGYTAAHVEYVLFDSEVNADIEDEPDKYGEWDIIRPPADPVVPPEPKLEDFVKEEAAVVNRLKSHLSSNSYYYNRAVWLFEDANKRARRFQDVDVGGTSLLDLIENRPLDVYGSYVAFPSNLEIADDRKPSWLREANLSARVEKLMTLPARGVFGEAKLGHCNASEEIDNTRFWDWQTSPIPEQAPEVQPLDLGTRNVVQKLEGTTLPGSLVNIVNPSNLPDPHGLSDALKLLGTANLFRDMSGRTETSDLLKKLSDNSVRFAEIAEKALEVGKSQAVQQGQQGQQGQQSVPQSSTPTSSAQTPSTKVPTEEEKRKGKLENDGTELEQAKKYYPPKKQQEIRNRIADENKTPIRSLSIRLITSGDDILQVIEQADIQINGDHLKMDFFDGVGTVKGGFESGNFVLKCKCRIRDFPGKDLISMIPGLAPTGEFYLQGSGDFSFPTGQKIVSVRGVAKTKPVKIIVEGSGTVEARATFGGTAGANIEMVKLERKLEGQVTVGGRVLARVEYEAEVVTGGITFPTAK